MPARRVELSNLESWMKKKLTKQDEVVLEMTTNTWQLYDELVEYAGSVMVVHPPHVALITRSQVMNDKIAASILARLLAKGLLVGIWVPPQEVRELRGLVAQRQKMTRLATQAKNRLHAVIQRHHLKPPAGNPFAKTNNSWWQALSLGRLEKMNLQSDLETLAGKTEIWLEAQQHLLPAPAVEIVQNIGTRLDQLAPQLSTLDERDPAAREVRKLVGEHLPELVNGYKRIPASLKQQDNKGKTPEEQLVSGLKLIDREIETMTGQIARGELDKLAVRDRYLELKYDGADN